MQGEVLYRKDSTVPGRHLEAGRGAQCSPTPAPRWPRGHPQCRQLRADPWAHTFLRAHLSEPHMRIPPGPFTAAPSSDSAVGNDPDAAPDRHAGGCGAASARGLRAGAALLSRDKAPRRRARRGGRARAPRSPPPQPPPRDSSPRGGCSGSAIVWFRAVPPPPSPTAGGAWGAGGPPHPASSRAGKWGARPGRSASQFLYPRRGGQVERAGGATSAASSLLSPAARPLLPAPRCQAAGGRAGRRGRAASGGRGRRPRRRRQHHLALRRGGALRCLRRAAAPGAGWRLKAAEPPPRGVFRAAWAAAARTARQRREQPWRESSSSLFNGSRAPASWRCRGLRV